jgi:polysaccharide export outer membrane protein
MGLFRRLSHPSLVAGGFLIAALLAAAPALGEILVERGDTLHVSVAEAPKLSGDSKVDAEGKIILPQLGGVSVAGLSLDAIRARLKELLIGRGLLKSPTVMVEIAKYRPLYVGGKVKRPGAVDYEPGFTVRHALILAGGPGEAEQDRVSPANIADLHARWKTATYQLLQVNSRIARLEAELARNDQAEPPVASGAVPAQEAQALIGLDRKILQDRLATWTGSQAHLREGMALLDLEIDVLGKQAKLQEKERELDKDQVEAARALVQKGLLPLPRLQELQNAASRASRDLLDNQAYTARARQNRATIEYEFNSADTNWRIDIRQKLRDAMLDRVRVKSELDAISAQVLDAGAAIEDAAGHARIVIVIYRSVAGREETIKAQMDTQLLPGDILEVSFASGVAG